MRKAIVISAAALAVISVWLLLLAEIGKPEENTEIKKYLELAGKQSAQGAYGSAIRLYQRVIEIEDSAEHRMLLIKACEHYGDRLQYAETLKDAISVFPDWPEAYEKLAALYFSEENYRDCSKVIRSAREAGAVSEELDELYYKSAFRYKISKEIYDDASVFVNGYAVVHKDNIAYIVNEKMDIIGGTCFNWADFFFGNTAAVQADDNSYFIDRKGEKYFVPAISCIKIFSLAEGRAAVQYTDGFGYINSFGDPVLGRYQYASSFSGGMAAVRDQEGWRLIDPDGKPINDEHYEDVKIGGDNTVGKGGNCFAKSDGYYILIDSNGKRIGDRRFEDAKPFMDDSLTAVKAKGLWGFIDRSGQMLIEPQYEDAQPFSEGLAAVRAKGNWGFIDCKNVKAIDFVFQEAKSFSDNGMAPVKIDGSWTYISLDD